MRVSYGKRRGRAAALSTTPRGCHEHRHVAALETIRSVPREGGSSSARVTWPNLRGPGSRAAFSGCGRVMLPVRARLGMRRLRHAGRQRERASRRPETAARAWKSRGASTENEADNRRTHCSRALSPHRGRRALAPRLMAFSPKRPRISSAAASIRRSRSPEG